MGDGEIQANANGEDESPMAIINVTFAPKITFASHQNSVPAVLDLSVENVSEIDLENLTLSISSEPAVLGARSWSFDRIAAGSKLRPRDSQPPLAGGLLHALTDRLRADVRLVLKQGETVLAETLQSIEALAQNEWGGAKYMPELLAAFVAPNDPSVQRLLKETSELLATSGKSSTIEGYQKKSRTRVWEILSGVWAAVSARHITYAVPPASFESTGQKIRLPSSIESTGLATCLDTALLFAAAFEQAGLHPVVVFTKGHAIVGAWLQPLYFPNLTVDEPILIRKAIALKDLVVFETTLATSDHPVPFTKAIAEGTRLLSEENEDEFVYAIDIKQARRRGIQPLSSFMELNQEVLRPGQPRSVPPLDQAPDLPPFDPNEEKNAADATPEERVGIWCRSLLDLSKRNRLLNAKPSATMLPIFCPDPGALEDKIAEGVKIKIITPPIRNNAGGEADESLYRLRTGDDWSEQFALEALNRKEIVAKVDEKALERGCIELFRKSKADFEEGGSNTLFLVIGVLQWCAAGEKDKKYCAPMVMVPVKFERNSARSKPYLIKHEDDAVFNMTLLEMLRQDFKIDLPELSGELPEDASGVDIKGIFEIVRRKVRDVQDFEVVEDVLLGTFSFAKYLMWKDLKDRTDKLKQSPFVRHLVDTPREPYQGGAEFLDPHELDQRIKPSAVFAPLNADSSQISAIYASGVKGDFVLEGPPGTGKSETIGNIIAHNLALGRKVLFVSEKMEALNVVHERLRGAGLGDFCLELHSAKSSKKNVIEQLSTAWSRRGEQTGSEWNETAGQVLKVRNSLNDVVNALHKPGPAGISVRDAIGRALRFGSTHKLALDWPQQFGPEGRAATPEAFEALLACARKLGLRFSQLNSEDLESLKEVNQSEWSFGWQSNIVGSARKVAAGAEALLAARAGLITRLGIDEAPATVDEACMLEELTKCFPHCERLDLRFVLTVQGRDILELLTQLAALLKNYQQLRDSLTIKIPDEKVAGQPITQWLEEKRQAEGRSWPLRGMALKKLRSSILAGYGISAVTNVDPEAELERLQEFADIQKKISSLAADLPRGTFWHGLNTDLEQMDQDIVAARRLRSAVQTLANTGRNITALRTQLTQSLCDTRELLESGSQIDMVAKRFEDILDVFGETLADYYALAGGTDVPIGSTDIAQISARAGALTASETRLNPWSSWVGSKKEARTLGLGSLVTALEEHSVGHEEAVDAFRTAYCKWVVPELIDGNSELTKFSGVEHGEIIKNFRRFDEKLGSLTASYIRAKLSATVPSRNQVQTDPGFGVLSRQIQAQHKALPVRQLVGQMGETLTRLVPCLLMSPLSVAQFLPAELAMFDLVVFDEASQITVPDAVGAIARGNRSIVVGDPKQMPPTRFFERGAAVAFDDDGDDLEDLESILDEALAARIPLHRLTGHYRSRHESLIAYSNHAYYKGELITYPSADTRESAVVLKYVHGTYAKGKSRTNPIEAKAVATAVIEHLLDSTRNHLSIGVVTLNTEQQREIENLLDEQRRSHPKLERFFSSESRYPVFIKNLETVQGDQRDVIIISICYGPTEPGAMTMSMNFGPLNRKGGERRLNVAITRATSDVIVFCSFNSSMIDLTRSQATAVKDLKHYLEFAEKGPSALGAAVKSIGEDNQYDSDFEMSVAEGLRQLGWVVKTQIGVSKFRIDLGIVHPDYPGKFLAGVECDGATYHRSPTARDRDRVRHIVLEGLGWKLVRIWSTEWFLDPQSRLAKLNDDLKALLELDRNSEIERAQREVEQKAASLAESELGDAATEVAEKKTITSSEIQSASSIPAQISDDDEVIIGNWKEAQSDKNVPKFDGNRFHDTTYQTELKRMAELIIIQEGPVTFKRISDLIARDHGFQKTGRQISSTVWAAVKSIKNRVRTSDDHDVFWPIGVVPSPVHDFRGLEIAGKVRGWKEVPLPERLGLVKKIAASSPVDIARAVAGAIGYERLTETFREEISELQILLKT